MKEKTKDFTKKRTSFENKKKTGLDARNLIFHIDKSHIKHQKICIKFILSRHYDTNMLYPWFTMKQKEIKKPSQNKKYKIKRDIYDTDDNNEINETHK